MDPSEERAAGGGRQVRRFGEVSEVSEEEELTYGGYLRLPDLLSLQTLLSDPPAHDELLFIVVHQAYELWFREMVFELETVRDLMASGNLTRARHYLERVHAIERLMVEQIAVLETMSPQDFMEFRSNLSPASGFQSVQFREIEFLSGLKNRALMRHLGETSEELERLERRFREPTLWDGFCELLERNGLPMPGDDEEVRRKSMLAMAREPEHLELFYLSEALLSHDELFSLWRQRHVLMVERMIGSKTGTGGSSGASYLRTTLDRKFYPELWELRSSL
ncbi:MAG: tryptophan 2,3-dioxygenase [Actinobacteria bacterium]|nr:tryptophan 2,3-dioxygenase [Actinomycetota bacterium]